MACKLAVVHGVRRVHTGGGLRSELSTYNPGKPPGEGSGEDDKAVVSVEEEGSRYRRG